MILTKCIWREEDGLDNKPTYDTSFPISTQVITSTDDAFSQENIAHVYNAITHFFLADEFIHSEWFLP